MTQQERIALSVTLAVTLILGACNKQEPRSSPPAAAKSMPPESALAGDQSASIWADPDSIRQGSSASLTWRTTNANEVYIDRIGAVPTNGSLSVSPAASTIYHLTAKGTGGTLDVTTEVTVKQITQQAQAH